MRIPGSSPIIIWEGSGKFPVLSRVPSPWLFFLFLYGKGEDTVGTVGGVLCFIQMIPLIGVVAPTEKALHKAFDKDGKKCLSQKRKET